MSDNSMSEEEIPPSVKCRRLGPIERYLSAWNHLNFYLNAAVTGYYTSPPLTEPQSSTTFENIIFHALTYMIHNHPNLSCVPVAEDTPHAYFTRLQLINPHSVVKFIKRKQPFQEKESSGNDDVELDEILEKQHNTPFKDTTKPFWRLIILFTPSSTDSRQRFAAAFIFHHALADGASGLIFHQEFLKALNTPNSAPTFPLTEITTIKTPSTAILPEMEKLITFKLSLAFLAKAFWEDKFPSLPKGLWTGSRILEPSHRNFRSRSFSPDVTAKLVKLCRENDTTVQAALQVLVANSLFEMLPEEVLRLRCIVPVSLRRWCGLAEGEEGEKRMGTCISSIEEIYERKTISGEDQEVEGQGFWWDEARRSRRNMMAYLERKGRNDGAGLFKYIGNGIKFCASRIGKERGGSFELSNLGRFGEETSDLEPFEEERWRVGRMVFGQSASVMSAAILVTVVTGGDGGMTLGFAWQDGVVDDVVVERLMASL